MNMCVQIAGPLFYTFRKNPGLNSQAFARMRSCCWHLFSESPWTISQNGGCAFTTFLCKRSLTANQCHQFLNPCVTGGGNVLKWRGLESWENGDLNLYFSHPWICYSVPLMGETMPSFTTLYENVETKP